MMAAGGDTSGRFTNYYSSDADGDMDPVFSVLKVTCKDASNLSNSRVLKQLLGSRPGQVFDPADGWVLKMWEGDVWYANSKLPDGGKWQHHKRPYLTNPNTLDVVTVQNKA
jgi:hypothetical protein